MNGFLKRKLPAFVLALVMLTSLVPTAFAVEEHEHEYDAVWHQNGTHHWHECIKVVGCDAKSDYAEHDYGNAIYTDTPATCHSTGTGHKICTVCENTANITLPADPSLHVKDASAYKYDATQHWHSCANAGCDYQFDLGNHTAASSSYAADTSKHWQVCTVCGQKFNEGTHTDVNSDRVCDTCGRTMTGYQAPTSSITVTFNNAGTTSSVSISSGTAPAAPANPTKSAAANCTYTFKGWVLSNPGTGAAYAGQSPCYTSAEVGTMRLTANTTYYAVYTASATYQDFSFSASTSGGTVGSTIVSQIDTKFTALTGRHFATVSFTNTPSSSYGVLYADSARSALGTREYAYSGTSYPAANLYFLPGTSGDYTVRYTAKDGYSTITGTITITSTASNSSTITYTAAPGGRVSFRASDFYSAFNKLSGGASNLRWVEFTPTTAYENFDGKLYSGSLTMLSNRLNGARFYYNEGDMTTGSYLLSDLSFQPSSSAWNGDSVSISYRAYSYSDVYYDGILKLVVSKDGASDDTITVRVAPGGSVILDRTAFNRVYRAQTNAAGTIRYIAFSAGSDYADFSGKLYVQGHSNFTQSDLSYNGEIFTYERGSYSDYAIDDLTFQATNSARDGDTLSIPFRAYYSASSYVTGTLKIVIDKYGSADTITYEVAPNSTVDLTAADFNTMYRTMSGNSSRTIAYVVFSAQSSYSSFDGSLYTGSTALSRTDLTYTKTLFYYNNSSDGDYALSSLSFRTTSSARVGDSITIPFRAHYTDRDYEEGILKIDVTDTAARTIRYEVVPNGTVTFKPEDFNNVYRTVTGNSRRDIAYAVFDAPSAYTSFAGKIYSGSTSFSRSDLAYSNLRFYYSSRTYGDYDLGSLTFKADSNAREGNTLNIPFRVHYNDNDYEEGTLKIVISNSASGTVNYTVEAGGSTTFKISDFNDAYRAVSGNSTRTIRYVTFAAPTTYDSFAGKVYTNASGTALSRTDLTYTKTKFYYSSQTYGDYALSALVFKANSTAKEGASISIPFRAHYTDSDYAEGTLKITVKNGTAGDISYTVTPGKTVNISRTDFNTYLQKTYSGYNVSYVVFDQPSTTEFNPADGTFYCGYGTSYANSFSRTTLPNVRFYYSKEDVRDGDYELDDLTFAAASSFTSQVTLTFTAYSTGSRSVTGTMVIKPVSASAASNYLGNIRYAVTSGTNVQLNANDIARYYRSVNTTDTLQYVTFSDVPSTGGLYYNYYNASSYGTATREQLTAANRSGRSFYMSPTSTSQYALTELTYVPSGSNYCVTIPFTAYGTSGRSLTGGIIISVSSKAVSEVYGATPKNTAVTFPASAIYAAVSAATGSNLSSIQLLKLPAAKVGVIYLGTGTTTPATTTAAYSYAASTQQMSQLRFVPANNYTGSVEIPYVALNANGAAIASGVFSLGIVDTVKNFSDVTTSTWCYKYVVELADASVIDGYTDGSFKQNNTITYGAALKLVMLAAGYPELAPTDKSSVFSGYLARARADGLITRTNVNLGASITRLQVAQLAAGAMKLDINNLSSVKPFTDTSDVYVQALNAAGIVEGYFNNGVSTFKPSNTLTRGQVSAIVWRMRNYNK